VDRAADAPTSLHPVQDPHIRFRDGLGYCVVVFLVLRLALSILAISTVGVVHPPGLETDTVPPLSPGWHNVLDGTDRWDAKRFQRIAASGYEGGDQNAAFFPGYPIGIRVMSSIPALGEVGAASLLSNLAFLGALVVLYALTSREYSTDRARRTTLLLACFPTSFFFLAPYSESLFLLTSVLTFWWARGGRWWRAGVAGFLAASIRNVGVLLVPALLIEAVRAPKARRPAAIVCSLIPMLAPLALGLYWRAATGDLLAPFHAEDSWHKAFEFPLITLGHALSLGLSGLTSARGLYWTVDLIVTAAIVVPLALRWRVIPPAYLAYVAATLLVIFMYPLPERPLVSAPRYALVLFPAFWAMADLWTGRALRLVVASFSIGWVVLSVTFMNWGYVF
jgi:hypothetical protein